MAPRDDHPDPAQCADPDCMRWGCRKYKEGFADGAEQGFAAGHAAGRQEGFDEGYSAGRADAGA